jgi:hypothetical protein
MHREIGDSPDASGLSAAGTWTEEADMMLIEDRDGNLTAVRPRLRNRLSAHVHADRIDRELAAGRSPETNLPTALRAAFLTGTRSRYVLALGLERALQTVLRDTPGRAGSMVNRAGVEAAAADLARLAHLLLEDGPVQVAGVAQTRILLTDGGGPLHSRRGPEPLALVVRRAIDALQAQPSRYPA